MEEAGLQAPEIPAPPAPQAQQQHAQQVQQMAHLRWSHFNPEFSGKPEEDAKHIYLEQMIG